MICFKFKTNNYFFIIHNNTNYFVVQESDEDLPYQPAPDSPTRTGAANSGSDDEEDPLDAFMSGIDTEVKRQEKEDKKKVAQVIEAEVVISGGSGKGQQPQAVRTDLEEEDVEESYYRYFQKVEISYYFL